MGCDGDVNTEWHEWNADTAPDSGEYVPVGDPIWSENIFGEAMGKWWRSWVDDPEHPRHEKAESLESYLPSVKTTLSKSDD